MDRCFVIQPFDNGKFDQRYQDTFAPAIEAAGLNPYRIDRDPGTVIVIDDIERNIRDSKVCLADITTDNPNVWYEVGFALASRKDVVLLCSSEREGKFPFDIQHRVVLRYGIESASAWEKLKQGITERLNAIIARQAETATISDMSPERPTEGLSPHEIAALVVIAEACMLPDGHMSDWQFRQGMNRAGFTDLAASVSIRSLEQKGLARCRRETDDDGRPVVLVWLTAAGDTWLLQNQSRFEMRISNSAKRSADDEIPF